MYTYILLEGHD